MKSIVVVLLLMTGCSLVEDNELVLTPIGAIGEDGQHSFDAVEAAVGPAGGTIEGPEHTALEGVRLEIPAGALTETQVVGLSVTYVNAPLPDGAEPIGPTIRVSLPSGKAFATAANLTLPLYRELLGNYGQETIGVKVWYVASPTTAAIADDWNLLEPTGTTAAQTQVSVNGAGAWGAGVKVTGDADTTVCGDDAACTVFTPATSCELSGWCITRHTLAPAPNTDAVAVFGEELRWLVRQDETTVVEYSLAAPWTTATMGATFNIPVGDLNRDYGYVVDSSGTSWIGTRSAVFGSDGSRVPYPDRDALVVGLSPAGRPLTVSVQDGALLLDQTASEATVEAGDTLPSVTGRAWLSTDAGKLHITVGPQLFAFGEGADGWAAEGVATMPSPPIAPDVRGHVIGEDNTLYWNGSTALTDLPRVGQIAPAGEALWVATTDVPGVVWVSSAERYHFTTAPAGTAADNSWRHIVRRLFGTDDGGLIAVTRGGEAIRMQRTP